jgi:hypothetical protein
MQSDTIETLALSVARILGPAVEREGCLTDPGSWIAAARKLGARTQGYKDRSDDPSPGFFVADALGGVIYYNMLAVPEQVCRCLCHEIAHFLLAQWTGSGLRRKQPELYSDERESLQHRAAKRTEEILLGEIDK